MPKKFSAKEAIDITYNYGNQNKAKNLEEFVELAGLKRNTTAFNSVSIHAPNDQSLFDIEVHIEKNDRVFSEQTRTPAKLNQLKHRIDSALKSLFPSMKILTVWYSGFNHPKRFIVET